MRSVSIPAGRRQMEPLSTATAAIQLSWVSESPNSSWMGLPRMPNISQTANIRVKAVVEIHMTRLAWEPVRVGTPVVALLILLLEGRI